MFTLDVQMLCSIIAMQAAFLLCINANYWQDVSQSFALSLHIRLQNLTNGVDVQGL